MASISPYETSSGKRLYMVQFRRPDRTLTKKRGFKTKKEAQLFASELEISKSTGTFINPQAGRTTIEQLHEIWLPSQEALAHRTKSNNLSSYKVHVQPRWATWSVGRISAPDVREWVADMQAEGKKRDTIQRAIYVLRSICEVAVEKRMIRANPVQKISVKRERRKEHAYLTPAQVETFAGVQETEQATTIIYVLAYCGLRISELAALDVQDFQAAAKRLSVTKAIKDNAGTIGPTKTYEKRRVPVPGFLCQRLEKQTAGRPPSSPLFLSPEGARLDVGNYRARIFIPSVDDAIKAWEDAEKPGTFPRIRPHGLRHTCASLAISVGANVKAVQGLLGHESAAITLNTYADLFPDDLEQLGTELDTLRNAQL